MATAGIANNAIALVATRASIVGRSARNDTTTRIGTATSATRRAGCFQRFRKTHATAAPTTITIRAWTTSGRSLSQSTAPM